MNIVIQHLLVKVNVNTLIQVNFNKHGIYYGIEVNK